MKKSIKLSNHTKTYSYIRGFAGFTCNRIHVTNVPVLFESQQYNYFLF